MSVRRWGPPVVWAAFILFLTSIPGADLPHLGVPHIDKFVHVTMYAVFGWLVVRAVFRPERILRIVVLGVLCISLFGAADEWHQQFIPGRSVDVSDWVIDSLSAAVGAAAAATALRRERRA